MNKEDYVTYEVAKMLKEKGYKKFTSDSLLGEFNKASLWDAAKWLREEHNIDVLPSLEYDALISQSYSEKSFIGYGFNIYRRREFVDFSMGFDSYEQALNEGILRALNLI